MKSDPASPAIGTSEDILRSRQNKTTWLFVLLIILYSLYALIFIERTSFLIGGQRYFCLFDDAMISMVYAKNMAAGHGLVYNLGQARVEGYSNLLWVLFMAAIHLFKSSLAQTSLVVQISELISIVMSLIYVRRIANRIFGSDAAALGAVFLTAFYFPINNWALQGMDVGPVMLVLCIVIDQVIRSGERNQVSPWLFIVLGLGTLLRIDFFLYALATALFLIITVKNQRKTVFIYATAMTVLFVGGQTLFRLLYYGEWLPNTYYLKVAGIPIIVRGLMGLTSTAGLIGDLKIVIFFLPFAYIIYRRKSQGVQCLLVIISATLLYNIYVGGDAWDWYGGANRYWAAVMPFFFILLSASIREILNLIRSKSRKSMVVGSGLQNLPYYALIFAVLFAVHSSPYRGHLSGLLLQERALHFDEHVCNVAMSRFIKDVATPDATIAGTEAGAIKYFTENPFIDLLGKTDRTIAKGSARWGMTLRDYERFRPGHNKCDGTYSIKKLQPDVILRLWCDQAELKDYLDEHYFCLGKVRFGDVYIKFDTNHIKWSRYEFNDRQMIAEYFNPPTTPMAFYLEVKASHQIDQRSGPR